MRYACAVVLVLLAAACGSHSSAPATTVSTTLSTTPPSTTASSPGALHAEATAAAAGDIPDNQVFVTYSGSRFSIKYPEGWLQSGSGGNVTFRDKNNIVRIVVRNGGAATTPSLKAELANLHGITLTTPPRAMRIGGAPAAAATYRTTSAPSPVTGKRVTLTVDRYVLAHAGRRATVDLGTPVGVDNVDAYRMMIASFRWR